MFSNIFLKQIPITEGNKCGTVSGFYTHHRIGLVTENIGLI